MCRFFFFFSSRRRHTRSLRDWSSDVCSSDLRAIVHRPRILVFDDSFSALDLTTDARLRQALWRELPDVTKIVVAQRVSRSEEHTSELQSRRDLVCRLLLEKKKPAGRPGPHGL